MKTIALASSLFALTLGCSALPRQEPRRPTATVASTHAEMRGVASDRARRAKALLAGPALLKHLETEGDGVVTLYLADDPGIRDRACPSAASEDASPIAILGPQSRITDLAIPEGKRVCAFVTSARSMSLTWHAEEPAETLRRTLDLAFARP
jgi:hypothetical protein